MDNYEKNLQLLMDKVDGVQDLDWRTVADMIGLDMHEDSLRKAWVTTPYGGYAVAKYFMDKATNELADDMIDLLQKKKEEEYKERVKLQDARREYNKNLRIEARYDNLVDILKDSLKNISSEDIAPFGERHNRIESRKSKHAILMLSDWHYGALCDSQWNFYNTEIAAQRAQTIVEKTQKYILAMGITDLVVEVNGDFIEGNIHVGNRVASEESAVEQVIGVSKLLARCINSLKPYVNSLKVVTTLGNHGRLQPNKKDAGDERENFEMLIPEFLRLSLDKDISIISSQGLDFVKYECGDKTICLAHGHHDKPTKAVDNMVRVYKIVPDEVHLGHLHHMIDRNDSNIHITMNGGLKGVDDFALGATRCITKPSQGLIVYGEDRIVIELIAE